MFVLTRTKSWLRRNVGRVDRRVLDALDRRAGAAVTAAADPFARVRLHARCVAQPRNKPQGDNDPGQHVTSDVAEPLLPPRAASGSSSAEAHLLCCTPYVRCDSSSTFVTCAPARAEMTEGQPASMRYQSGREHRSLMRRTDATVSGRRRTVEVETASVWCRCVLERDDSGRNAPSARTAERRVECVWLRLDQAQGRASPNDQGGVQRHNVRAETDRAKVFESIVHAWSIEQYVDVSMRQRIALERLALTTRNLQASESCIKTTATRSLSQRCGQRHDCTPCNAPRARCRSMSGKRRFTSSSLREGFVTLQAPLRPSVTSVACPIQSRVVQTGSSDSCRRRPTFRPALPLNQPACASPAGANPCTRQRWMALNRRPLRATAVDRAGSPTTPRHRRTWVAPLQLSQTPPV